MDILSQDKQPLLEGNQNNSDYGSNTQETASKRTPTKKTKQPINFGFPKKSMFGMSGIIPRRGYQKDHATNQGHNQKAGKHSASKIKSVLAKIGIHF